ncbi:MAG TPA: hypothetical protein VFQ53_00990 [Kofleriaceae bacterium]|nr:hypothetical protein [Kofleriaceae bacterium]
MNGPSTPPGIAAGCAWPSVASYDRPVTGSSPSVVSVTAHHCARPSGFCAVISFVPVGHVEDVTAHPADSATLAAHTPTPDHRLPTPALYQG